VTVQVENISRPSNKVRSRQQLVEDSREHLKAVALRTYSGQKSSARGGIEDEQIVQFLPMVHKIAHRAVTYLKPPLSFEDLISAGTIGLLKAARDFDSSHHAEFKTYAYIRIKGAVLDELRNSSLLPANLNRQVRNAQQITQQIIGQTGTAPTDEELAEKLGITVDEVYELLEGARAQHFVSLDGPGQEHSRCTSGLGDFLPAPDTNTPDKHLEQTELIDKLTECIQQLDQRRRQIILLYYQQQLTMKQIACVFNVTESRVSQLHASALFNLSMKLRQWNDAR
jgi:RNA polymerase sigma factor for flagellar operon FliA